MLIVILTRYVYLRRKRKKVRSNHLFPLALHLGGLFFIRVLLWLRKRKNTLRGCQ
jgi:hypothetical protein